MAGNIIPAIATTNAIIAGLIVLEGLKVLTGQLGAARTVSTVELACLDHLFNACPGIDHCREVKIIVNNCLPCVCVCSVMITLTYKLCMSPGKIYNDRNTGC